MVQRGRKSAESLSAVANIPGQRAQPPAELTEEQAAEWRAIVATKPPEWFNRDSQALLCDMCRHTVIARRISDQVDSFPLEQLATEEGLERYEKLGKMLERHSRTVAMLAVKMRLAPQSRYEAKVAGTAAKSSGSGAARPWEIAS